MPEDLDVGAEEAAQDTGMDSGSDGGPEPTGSDAQASPSEPVKPDYMTRAQFEEALSGYSSSQQERLDKSFGGLQDLIKQIAEGQKPKPPPLIPDSKSLESIDANGMRDLLMNIVENHKGTEAQLRKELADLKQEYQAGRIHGHLSDQIGRVSGQYPMFKNPTGEHLLKLLTIGSLEMGGRDLKKLNLPGVTQSLNKFIDEQVQARIAARTRTAAQTTASPQPQGGATRGPDGKFVAPRTPPKGAPAKPGENPGGGTTMKNFRERARAMIEQHFPKGDD